MNDSTARALHALSQNFYSDAAEIFAETRSAPWPGWVKLLPLLRGRPGVSVLDVGCGNARFASFLRGSLGAPFLYCGIDASAPLLELAARATADLPGARLLRADLLLEPLERALPDERFDLVAAFGLLHHIPGEARRRDLIRALADRVAPRGHLALTFWDFAREPRFARRLAGDPPPDFARDLEDGDFLLRWGPEGSRQLRYCHQTDAAEEARLLADLPLEDAQSFSSDGPEARSNRYRILRRI